MKRILLILLLLLSFITYAQTNSNHVYVNGYTRSNGTYVEGHYRTAPNSTVNDNFSTVGNTNPYTGQAGYIARDGGTSYSGSTTNPTYTTTSTSYPIYNNGTRTLDIDKFERDTKAGKYLKSNTTYSSSSYSNTTRYNSNYLTDAELTAYLRTETNSPANQAYIELIYHRKRVRELEEELERNPSTEYVPVADTIDYNERAADTVMVDSSAYVAVDTTKYVQDEPAISESVDTYIPEPVKDDSSVWPIFLVIGVIVFILMFGGKRR
jgi:uncharacterized protein YxeA